MKKLLPASTSIPRPSRLLRSTSIALIGAGLSFALWSATAPVSVAQGQSPQQRLQSNLPRGTTPATASKMDLLSAITGTLRNNKQIAPQVAGAAAQAQPGWAKDILQATFQSGGTGSENCGLLARVLAAIVDASPDQAAELTEMAIQMAGNCSDAFERSGRGGVDQGEGNFGNVPNNQNPPPGSFGGSGGQGNVVAICHNGRTLFVSPRGAENHLRNHQGDTAGPCTVTPNQNQ